MRVVETIAELRTVLRPIRHGRTIGLVPTMGAFHDGHLSLMRAARAECDIVVTSLFVNPAQFGAGEDVERYPRDREHDESLAEAVGVDVLFVPSAETMYPPGFKTWVEVEGLGEILEGQARPGHLRAVATICLKLFGIVQPDRAYFGQKDVQQAVLVRRMATDLDLDLAIRILPTVRDPDGLALSSRNVYLDREEREQALVLPRALDAGAEGHRRHAHADAVARAILAGERSVEPEYVEVAQLEDLLVLAAAVRVGRTRLIDNVLLEGVLL